MTSGVPAPSSPPSASSARPSSVPSDPLDVGADDDFLYYLRQGGELLQTGRPEEARTALERAFELKPDNPKAQNLLGLSYFKLGLLEAAKTIYDRLIRDFPNEPPLHVNLGLVLLRQGRLDEAERTLRTALELAPGHVRAHCYLGLALYRRGHLIAARDHFIQGDAPELVKKVERRLAAGGGRDEDGDVLGEVAEAGVRGLEAEENPFRPVEATEAESLLRDEEAWETHVAHRDASSDPTVAFGVSGLEPVPSRGLRRGLAGQPPPPPATEAYVAREPGVRVAPPRQATGSFPVDILSVVPPPPEVPYEMAFGLPPPAGAAPPVATVATAARVEPVGMEPAGAPTAVPAALVSGRPSHEPILGQFPRIPLIEPWLRLYSDLPWVPGFSTGPEPGSLARLVVSGTAYVRSSAIVAASGELRFEPAMRREGHRPTRAMLGGHEHPICRLEGDARVLLRTPHFAAALRDAETLHVLEHALMGFEGELVWDNRKRFDMEVAKLEGTGTILLDGEGPPLVATIAPGEPLVVASSAILAWTDGLSATPLSAYDGDEATLLVFRGQGLVILVGPHEPSGGSVPLLD